MSSADSFFNEVVEARNEYTRRQERYIRKKYNEWAREVKQESERLSKANDVNRDREFAKFYYQLRNGSRKLSSEINGEIKSNADTIGEIVVRTNKKWLSSLGLSTDSLDYRLSAAKDSAIRSILSGNLYSNGQPLSDRIWNATESNLKDIYSIIGRGIALNMSPDQIAVQLEKYLNTSKNIGYSMKGYSQSINGPMKYMGIQNNKVDWRAQRLVRTVLQHAYQQSLIATTKDNPLVVGYIWHADGAHSCPICLDRDNTMYSAESMPLDHPNGQCDFEVVVKEGIVDGLSIGIEYPDINRWIDDE